MSDLLSQFGRQPQTLFTNIGQGARQLGGQLIQAEQGRRKKEASDAALSAYMSDKTPDNLFNALNLAPDQEALMKNIGAMDKLTQQNQITSNMQVADFLATGFEDRAIEELDKIAIAYETDGNPDNDKDIEGLRDLITKIENGQGAEVGTLLELTTASIPGGKERVDASLSYRADRRAEEEHISEELIKGIDIEYASPEHETYIKTLAKDMRNPEYASLISEMGRVRNMKDDMTGSQLDSAAQNWRNIYFKETTDWRKAANNAEKVQSAGKLAIDTAGGTGTQEVRHPITGELVTITGPADLSLINSFQRLIDPATVRQGDIDLMRNTVGGLDRAELAVSSFFSGAKLDDNQRVMIMEMSEQIMEAYAGQEIDSREVVLANTRDLGIPDKKVVGTQLLKHYMKDEEVVEETQIESVSNVVPQATPSGNAELEAKRKAVALANPNSVNKDRFSTMSNEELNNYAAGRNFVYDGEATEEETVEVPY